MNNHVATDNHQYATAKSGMDNAILYYANQKDIRNSSSQSANSEQMDFDDDSDSDFQNRIGPKSKNSNENYSEARKTLSKICLRMGLKLNYLLIRWPIG